jgi:hypothetical protein
MLGAEETRRLLQAVRPVHVFSGDDHDHCEHVHEYGSSETRAPAKFVQGGAPVDAGPSAFGRRSRAAAREDTVPTFSWLMGVMDPGYALVSLTPAAHDAPPRVDVRVCFLPAQMKQYLALATAAVGGAVVLVVAALAGPLPPAPEGEGRGREPGPGAAHGKRDPLTRSGADAGGPRRRFLKKCERCRTLAEWLWSAIVRPGIAYLAAYWILAALDTLVVHSRAELDAEAADASFRPVDPALPGEGGAADVSQWLPRLAAAARAAARATASAGARAGVSEKARLPRVMV